MKATALLGLLIAVPATSFAQTCPNSVRAIGTTVHYVGSPTVYVTNPTAVMKPAKPADIVETAVAAGSFKTLVAAVKAADLVNVLKGDGPFTVFAPTDEAFAKIPPEVIANLLKPENKSKLQKILTYHVVPGKVTAQQVMKLSGAKSVQGEQIDVVVKDGQVMVDGAKVVKTDIMTSNGVIHVIDSVIMPSDKDLVETAVASKDFSTLVAAVKAAGLVETLKSEGPFTVFAPTDAAFAKLPKGVVEDLLKPENKQKLVDILTLHAVAGKVLSGDVVGLKAATTVNGQSLPVTVSNGKVRIGDATVTAVDIETTNGVIHVIDSVLLPK